jgi:HK97 family phage portal protein
MFTGFYLVSGNSYIEGVYAQASQPPKELYTLRPDRMSVIAGENGPAGYEYKVAGVSRKWVGDEKSYIRHIKTFHPTDDWYGLSPIEAAAFDIDVHNATLEWNKALLDNRAQPSGALSYKPTRDTDPSFLDDAKYARLKQELDSHIGSSGNAGRPLLLEGGLEWQSMSFSPQDMDYINSKNTTARDIAMAYGVPAQLLGIPGDNTYNNMGEARVALWEQTVLPLAYLLRDELNAWLAPQFGPEYYITIDEDAILALAPRRAAKWQQLQSADFLTTNEKREALGYEPVAGGDQVLAPANLLPIAYTTEPTGDEGAAETEKDFASWLVREEGYTEEKAATLAALAFEEQQ